MTLNNPKYTQNQMKLLLTLVRLNYKGYLLQISDLSGKMKFLLQTTLIQHQVGGDACITVISAVLHPWPD